KLMMENQQARINRFKLALLFFIPLLLMGAAYFIYFTGVGIPTGTSNKGLLIEPPVQITGLASLSDTSQWQAGNAMWAFLSPGGSNCDQRCKEDLYLSRQIRAALGKYSHRVQRIYLNQEPQTLASGLQTLLSEEHQDMKILQVDGMAFENLLQPSLPASEQVQALLYVVDPRGFIMLRYDQEHSYKDVIKDMKFLLKYSSE
ncbi:MAG: hypothetical protein ACR2PS_00090, partial [Pseudomonadales bacterium]